MKGILSMIIDGNIFYKKLEELLKDTEIKEFDYSDIGDALMGMIFESYPDGFNLDESEKMDEVFAEMRFKEMVKSPKFKGVIEYLNSDGEAVEETINGRKVRIKKHTSKTIREILETQRIYTRHIKSPVKANSRLANKIKDGKIEFIGERLEGKHYSLSPFGKSTKPEELEDIKTGITESYLKEIESQEPTDTTASREFAERHSELRILTYMEKLLFDAINAIMYEQTGGIESEQYIAIKPIYLYREVTGKTPKNGLTKKQEGWIIDTFMKLTGRYIEITTPDGFKYKGALIQGNYIKNPWNERLKDGIIEVRYSVLADYSKRKKQFYKQADRFKLLGILAKGGDSENRVRIRNCILNKFYLKTGNPHEFTISIDETLKECEIESNSHSVRARTADYVKQCLQLLKDEKKIKKFTAKTFYTKYKKHGINEFTVEK